jgi:predicted nucleotidyltransferase component of viral defense system
MREIVEQFHLLFLEQLGRKLDQRLYALKGGCNLRFYFNSIRYSEDIDLDVQTIAPPTLQNKINQILRAETFQRILTTRGILVQRFSEPKQTETTQRWKLELKSSKSTIIANTRIEFSRRDQIETAVFEPVQAEIIQQYHLMPILSSHYPAIFAYQQKIRALALRTQTQARDVFDLYLLLGRKDINSAVISPDVKSLLSQAQTQAMSIHFADFKSQVLAYLPFEYQQQYDNPALWDSIVLKVCEILGKS